MGLAKIRKQTDTDMNWLVKCECKKDVQDGVNVFNS